MVGMAARAKRRSMALGDTGVCWVEVEHKEGVSAYVLLR